MAGTLWALALRYLDARRRRSAPPRAKPPVKRPGQRPPGRSSESALGHRLASEPEVLERIVAVRPHSVAVLLTRDQPPQLKLPGEQLRPSLVPKLRPIQVVVVSTAVTHLDVTVRDLVSLDGYPIDRIKIRLAVQLSDTERYSTLVEMVADHSADLDDHLLRLVEHEVTTSLQRAVRMNRLADLRRQTLQRVLEDRWLPRGLAGGALLRRGFTVLEAPSPPAEPGGPAAATQVRPPDDTAVQPSPFSRPPAQAPPVATRTRLDLTMDARLHRVWRDHANQELLGIAGAKESDGITVIAVPSRQLGAYEGSRLEEAFRKYYADGRVRVVSTVAESYDDVVRAWFNQVDSSHGRVISVQPTADHAALRIGIDQDRLGAQGAEHEVTVGRYADRQALRALLPYERVEFVAADAS
ncbi:MAG TPA: hypothetical protein VNT24_10925 [Propionibacteriaceae bacterium]|nr:hypothetical protein [Propionibacteriaceae bacterium]